MSIEAMKQWLEALEEWANWSDHVPPKTSQAITSLRQAIAEAEHIKKLKEKTKDHDVDCLCADCEAFDNLQDQFYSAGYTTGFMDASVKAHEAKKQEPVAWIGEGGMKAMTDLEKQAWIQAGRAELVETYNKALYTHPQPKREPLTDEQLKPHYQNQEWLDGVRFAEAAHGIKGAA